MCNPSTSNSNSLPLNHLPQPCPCSPCLAPGPLCPAAFLLLNPTPVQTFSTVSSEKNLFNMQNGSSCSQPKTLQHLSTPLTIKKKKEKKILMYFSKPILLSPLPPSPYHSRIQPLPAHCSPASLACRPLPVTSYLCLCCSLCLERHFPSLWTPEASTHPSTLSSGISSRKVFPNLLNMVRHTS